MAPFGVILRLTFLVAAISFPTASAADCAVGEFTNKDGACEACPALPNCASSVCTTYYDATCQQCDAGHTGVLCTDCLVGFFKSPAGSCVACPAPSTPCIDGLVTCTSTGDARCGCGPGRFLTTTSTGFYCAPCASIPHCLQVSCDGPGGSVCETCVEGYVGPRCDSCTAGNFPMVTSGGVVECRSCPAIPRCQATACSSATDSYCVLCAKGLSGPECSSCDQGFYQNGDGECAPCPKVAQCRGDAICTSATDASCRMCNTGYAGAKCDKCSPGYYMKSDRTCSKCPKIPGCPNSVRCTSPKDATCGGCPKPDPPANGAVTGTSGAGDKITYTCNQGFTLDGVATRTCLDGQWTGSRPRCTKKKN